MSVALVTGSSGLIGCEAVRFFAEKGFDVVGVDNDMRRVFFGDSASTRENRRNLEAEIPRFQHYDCDIRDQSEIEKIYSGIGTDLEVVIHTAAQPSHDWAARAPYVDFTVNANGTLVLLESTKKFAPEATFIFTSTNKVYGDRPNRLPFQEMESRFDLGEEHEYWAGIDETMSIDSTMHSLFGASKVAADVLVQEYGRYFGMRTGVFRGGCLTGPRHKGAELHGFLAYLMKCTVTGEKYRVLGYKGKQVRDNIHSSDLISAFFHFFENPRAGEVYNIGGGRHSNCSMLEAITICEKIAGRKLDWEYVEEARLGDHIWWISALSKFTSHYPGWDVKYNVRDILCEIYDVNAEQWTAERVRAGMG